MATDPLNPKAPDQGKKALSMAVANAMVARARYSPRRRRAGRATTAPTAPASPAAASRPSSEPLPNLYTAKAPSPAKVSWQTET